ncbi:hypothetical protein SXCC_04497 [Gluconacetobacter sp. SXCC-1]|nr:hypothetical protein SXCC_04497 [Gluconacetobacter sp. SXCC-1]
MSIRDTRAQNQTRRLGKRRSFVLLPCRWGVGQSFAYFMLGNAAILAHGV